jgi:hypothetical protein
VSTGIDRLAGADSAHLYFLATDMTIDPPIAMLQDVTLAGTGTVTLEMKSVAIEPTYFGGLVATGTSADFVLRSSTSTSTMIVEANPNGGTPMPIAHLVMFTGFYIAADKTALYVDQEIVDSEPGIYEVSRAGHSSLFTQWNPDAPTTTHPRLLLLDARSLYWVAGAFGPGDASLHRRAR